MTLELSRSTVSIFLPPWKIGLTGSLSLTALLTVGAAQARPVPTHSHDRAAQSPQQVMADEQAKLADARVSQQEALQPPASAIAARSIAPPQSLPSMESSRSGYTNEDELIQQMAGTTTSRAKPARARAPVFSPPSSRSASAGATSAAVTATKRTVSATAKAQKTPFLITVGTNSDLGLGLFAPLPSDRCGAACEGPPLLVPSLPRMGSRTLAQSTPPPPYSTLPTPSLLDGATPTGSMTNGSLTNGSMTSEPLLLPTTSSPASIQPPAFRTQPAVTPPPRRTLLRTTALSDPSIKLQGVYLYQGDQSSARARLSISYPLTPHLLFGATFDLTDGNAFADSQTQGFSVNELYFAASLPELPNLRLVVGQLDLTSYFDRNSFAKDGATHFFNPVFQTNPALSATGISSRPGALVNWTLTDNIEAKAAVFSSSRNLGDFSLDGFAGEIGIRYGNAVIRGTYVTDRDAGTRDGFREIFQVARGNGVTGFLKGDREESYGFER